MQGLTVTSPFKGAKKNTLWTASATFNNLPAYVNCVVDESLFKNELAVLDVSDYSTQLSWLTSVIIATEKNRD